MDTFEELAHLYFRLNGFFTVPNYILHARGGQRGEVDVLAVRFAHKLEQVGGNALPDDPALHLHTDKPEMILAEVGRGKEDFNKPWKCEETMGYILNFAGLFEDERSLAKATTTLARSATYEDQYVRIRPILCTDVETVTDDATHRRLQGMLDFIVDRFRTFRHPKADHEQWRGALADFVYALATGRGRKRNIKLEELDRGYFEYRRRVLCR
jgi:hypothetical protein